MPKYIHFVGIKGIGASGLAGLLASQKDNAKISGSDNKEYFHSEDRLKKLGIKINPFSEKNINKEIDLVVYSSAYNENHPEIRKAKKMGIPAISYGRALSSIFNSAKGIAIAGTHGKTTTAGLIGHILVQAGLKPSAVIGGIVQNWQSNSRFGRSDWLVAEADEYQEKFLTLKPDYLVITNIDYDHSDWFKNRKSYLMAFVKFIKNIKIGGKLVMLQEEAKKIKKITPRNILLFPKKQDLLILKKSRLLLLGEHNKKNALLAISLARRLKIKKPVILKSLATFKGIKRRLEFYSRSDSKFIIVDDYGHHPEEIKATLRALRMKYKNYFIVSVFQPHTYTRTQKFIGEFAASFKDADNVVLLPIYSSAREQVSEKEKQRINQALFDKLKMKKPETYFAKNKTSAKNYVLNIKKSGNRLIILTIGAGDVWRIAEELTHSIPR